MIIPVDGFVPGPIESLKADESNGTSTAAGEHSVHLQNAWQVRTSILYLSLNHQSEVASLAEASAKKQAAIFTPYLLPDAPSLCTGLHTMKKLLKTEKFVVIIAKSGMCSTRW